VRDVLDDDDGRLSLVNDSPEFEPQPRSCSMDARTFPGHAEVLTREAAADQLGALHAIGSHVSHVGETLRCRPAALKHAPAERVGLGLPQHRPEAGALKAKLQSADAREERPDGQAHRPSCHARTASSKPRL
jgi:hypothetical protein